MEKFKNALRLFLTFFKIGLFTFGGGYAMVAIMERDLVEKKNWISHEEFLDLIAIAESTPGPLAINSATYIGYKVAGVFGSIMASLGVVLPSFIIIFAISMVFDKFMQIKYVQYAFHGIQACVCFLILSAGIKLLKHVKKTVLSVTLLVATMGCLVAFSLFSIKFSSVFYVLIGGAIGLIVYLISYISERAKAKKESKKDKGEE